MNIDSRQFVTICSCSEKLKLFTIGLKLSKFVQSFFHIIVVYYVKEDTSTGVEVEGKT